MTGPGESVTRWFATDRRRFDVGLGVLATALTILPLFGGPEEFDTGWPDVAAGVVAFALIVFRRAAPGPLLAIAMVGAAAFVGVYERPTTLIFAALILVGTVAVRISRWPAFALGAAIGASFYFVTLIAGDLEFGDERAVIFVGWTAAVIGIADATRSWRSLRASSEAQIRSAVLAAEAQTRQQVSEERLAIARELHDLLAHNLSVMNVQTGAAMHLLRDNPDAAEAALGTARDAGRDVLDELRSLLSVLRTDGDTDAPTSSLPTFVDVDALVDTMRTTGLDVRWTQTGEPRELAPAVSLAAYRIVQEGLTNAAKHGAGAVELLTTWSDRMLDLAIENDVADDNDPSGAGLGLVGMRERATANGGELETTVTDRRFVVSARLPTQRMEGDGS